MTRPDPRLITLDPSETGCGFPRPDAGLSGDDLDRLPQYRAARAKARQNAAARTHGRIRRWGSAALLALAILTAAVAISSAAPVVAYHLANPAIIQH